VIPGKTGREPRGGPEPPLERIPSGRAPREHPYPRRKCGSITAGTKEVQCTPAAATDGAAAKDPLGPVLGCILRSEAV
jgi:hypothetical protein